MTTETNVQHTPGRPVGFSFEIRDGIPTLPTEYPSACGCTITAKQTGVGFDYCATHAAAPALLKALEAMTSQLEESNRRLEGLDSLLLENMGKPKQGELGEIIRSRPVLRHARQAIALAKGEQDAN